MKAIKIDPHNKTVDTIITPDVNEDIASITDTLGCRYFDVIRLGDAIVFVDDEGLMVNRDCQAYWKFSFMDNPLAGIGLVYGTLGEATTDAFMKTSDIASIVEWLDPPSEEELSDLLTPRITTF